jgi:hypothetical protein
MSHSSKRKMAPGMFATALCVWLVSACSDYEFRVNQRVVYTPLPLFSDFTVADPALHDCLLQTIEDQKLVRAQDLTGLKCSHTGITSLEGLTTFQGIEWLYLPYNALVDISALADISALQVLDLSNNKLRDIAALARLTRLERVDLRGNPALDCQPSQALIAALDVQAMLPAHCTQ